MLQHLAASDARTVNEQLNFALTSRVAIEQAKGMVAEYRSCSVDQAFVTLRNHARNHNLRLADVAHRVVDRTQLMATLDQLRTGAE